MADITRIAKEEGIIILCTIREPSTKVYNAFDKVMILSGGQVVFTGDGKDAVPYFSRIGYNCPPATNPAEFFLDLVNNNSSDPGTIDTIIETWEMSRSNEDDGCNEAGDGESETSLTGGRQTNFFRSFSILIRRQGLIILREPILYAGRCVTLFVVGFLIAFVYWKARPLTQDQILNNVWLNLFLIVLPCASESMLISSR
jgi:hypothetical protein